MNELLKSVLLVVVSYALKLALAALGVQIDDVLFNTIVAAVVAYVLSLLGLGIAAKFAPKYFSVK
jgi:hypothetical protein